jgi:hypothetical protein
MRAWERLRWGGSGRFKGRFLDVVEGREPKRAVQGAVCCGGRGGSRESPGIRCGGRGGSRESPAIRGIMAMWGVPVGARPRSDKRLRCWDHMAIIRPELWPCGPERAVFSLVWRRNACAAIMANWPAKSLFFNPLAVRQDSPEF